MDDYDKVSTNYDKIDAINIEDEMRNSFIDYAMSVIMARALPDVRDGLKPVHRRILYSMNELNLDPTKAYKKSARITGDTMGKYHPHGDSSIYDAMVRMAQSFSMRYPLVDGHGNFGSMDGDGAAAPRYTEARLSRMAMEMIDDIEKQTVDFTPNYDGEFQEPVVLPSKFPNLLVNGSSGIAVGMAANIPPHNLTETIDALVKIIDLHLEEKEAVIEDILDIIKGPDFPTGASILGMNGIKQAYRTGRGKFNIRATGSIETMPNGREMIVFTEIPYQVNKAKLVEKIAELVKDKKLDGISDLRDESNRNGVRIVVELKKDVNAHVIMNKLYKFTPCQISFGVIMIALVDNEPKVLNLLQILNYYLEHQKEVITRRTNFNLNKAQRRAHILEGFLIALSNIDDIIDIVRSSKDVAQARERIIEQFGLTKEQAVEIVDMRLRSLTSLERSRLESELEELKLTIKDLLDILEDDGRLYTEIRKELLIMKSKYGDKRRTSLIYDINEIDIEDLIDEETSVVTMTHLDYIKRMPLNVYKSQNRGGKGVIGMQMRDEDIIKNIFIASTHDRLLFFTNVGRAYSIKAYEIPEAGRVAKGTAIVNLLNLNGGEKIKAVIPVNDSEDNKNFIMVTKKGLVKKMKVEELENIKKSGRVALNVREDDELIAVLKNDGDRDVFIATALGKGIRFKDINIRSMGRQASGVKAVRLADGDYVVDAGLVTDSDMLLFVSGNGFGKCTDSSEFSAQNRGGMGKIIYKVTPKTGNVVGVCAVSDKDELMIINSEGVVIRIRITDISVQGRNTQGVKLINIEENVNVVSIAKVSQDQIIDDDSDDPFEDNEDGSIV